MANSMTNIDIQSFTTVSSVNSSDYILLSRYSGTNGKIRMALLINNMMAKISPEIGSDGYWYVGGENTGVTAEGRTPQFALVEGNICVRYSDQDTWQGIVPISELRLDFSTLTDEQIAKLKMTYDDLSEQDKSAIQAPAIEAAKVADAATEESLAQTELCKEATDNANDTANHPTYIGTDNYVYIWNKATSSYDKTDIYVRGEAFSISKVFNSIAQMESYAGTDLKEGDFVMIDTGSVEDPDTAKLYVRTAEGGWSFIVDMSGAIGFTGKTPQLSVGTVTTGNPDTLASVAVSPDGTDADGNPKYKLNFTIPKGDTFTYNDLTPENIAELQRPANDMIDTLSKTNDSIKAEEETRVANEQERIAAEKVRKENEQGRVSAETARTAAEKARETAEQQRENDSLEAVRNANAATNIANQAAKNADTARDEAITAKQNADKAAANANTAAGKADKVAVNRPKIIDGVWWIFDSVEDGYVVTNASALGKSPYISDHETWMVYNDSLGIYEDSNVTVNSTYELSKGKVESVLTGDITTHNHDTQYKPLIFASVSASAWVADDTYAEYPYRCDLACEGVDASHYSEVTFAMPEALSGNYAPVCRTGDGIVTIYSTLASQITVPVVTVTKTRTNQKGTV